jgi:hypothetical protein
MNAMFGEWYRAAEIEPKSANLELRWKGVEALKTRSDPKFAEQLVRLHLALGCDSDEFLADFRKAFFDLDGTFRMAQNDIELQVLSGAVLSAILDRKDQFSDGVALTFVAAAAPELRKKFFLKDILTTAVKHLFNRASIVRSTSSQARTQLVNLEPIIEQVKTAASSNPATLGSPLEAAFKAIGDSLTKLNSNLDSRLDIITRKQDVLAEEANIVWWLFAGASTSSLQPFALEHPVKATFGAARDLSSLTLIIPPPIAASAYLAQCLAGHVSATFSLESLASAGETADELSSNGLFPLTTLLKNVANGKPPKRAANEVARLFKLTAAPATTPTLAFQYYREMLAQRFLGKSQ